MFLIQITWVVIVRVNESLQAPHAVENSTKVYFRPGSITQPYKYELADMDRITYMLRRREDSQVVARQVMTRMEEPDPSSLCYRGTDPNGDCQTLFSVSPCDFNI